MTIYDKTGEQIADSIVTFGSAHCKSGTSSIVVDGVTVRSDTNLILTNGVHFTLTEQELETLNQKQDEN